MSLDAKRMDVVYQADRRVLAAITALEGSVRRLRLHRANFDDAALIAELEAIAVDAGLLATQFRAAWRAAVQDRT